MTEGGGQPRLSAIKRAQPGGGGQHLVGGLAARVAQDDGDRTAQDDVDAPVQLPTEPGQLEATEARVTNIVKKLDRMPLEEIGNELRKSLADLDVTLRNANRMISTANETLVSAHGTLQNANAYLEPDSVKSQELDDTLQEVNRAARSIRLLTDYLQRHPEALLRGKRGEAQ